MAIITLTKANFEETIAQHEIIFVDFWAEWCGPCKSFAPIFESVAEQNPSVAFAKVDIDAEQELATAFQVRSIPLLVVMKQQVVVFSESGVLPASGLQNLVEQAKALDLSQFHQQVADAEKKSKD